MTQVTPNNNDLSSLLHPEGPNFHRVLSVIFRYTTGTRVSTVVAYSDLTIKSSDYVLSKAGLFSTNYRCLNSAI